MQKVPVIFNFYDYFRNPIVDFCVSHYPNKTVYTLDDLMPEIQKLRHSKWALESNKMSFIGDQLRLYLASKQDDFLYIDADCLIPDLSDIPGKNCSAYEPDLKIINNGTFFYTDKDCRFNKYYLNLYNTIPEKDFNLCNYVLFNKYLYEINNEHTKSGDMNLVSGIGDHFLVNVFGRFKNTHPDISTVYYTEENHNSLPIVWSVKDCPRNISHVHTRKNDTWYFSIERKYVSPDDMLKLFKEQLCYTYQKDLKFVQV